MAPDCTHPDHAAASAALRAWLTALHDGDPIQEPGMEFGAPNAWWGKRRPRPQPHEGVDIVGFTCAHAEETHSICDMPLRPVEPGECVAVLEDFLGFTAIVRRPPPSDLLWCYAHLALDENVRPGTFLDSTDVLGCVAVSDKACPAHLHLSLLHQDSSGLDWEHIQWRTIHAVAGLHFLHVSTARQSVPEGRACPETIVFIYHDPGAANHLLPLAKHASREGVLMASHDLRAVSSNADEASSAAVAAVASAAAESIIVFGHYESKAAAPTDASVPASARRRQEGCHARSSSTRLGLVGD